MPLDVYDEESQSYITRGITLDDLFKVIYNKIQETNDKVALHDTSINTLNDVTEKTTKDVATLKNDTNTKFEETSNSINKLDESLTSVKSDVSNKLNKVNGTTSTDSFVTITTNDVTDNEQTITPSVKTVTINDATIENNGLATALDIPTQLANYAKTSTITDDTININ